MFKGRLMHLNIHKIRAEDNTETNTGNFSSFAGEKQNLKWRLWNVMEEETKTKDQSYVKIGPIEPDIKWGSHIPGPLPRIPHHHPELVRPFCCRSKPYFYATLHGNSNPSYTSVALHRQCRYLICALPSARHAALFSKKRWKADSSLHPTLKDPTGPFTWCDVHLSRRTAGNEHLQRHRPMSLMPMIPKVELLCGRPSRWIPMMSRTWYRQ